MADGVSPESRAYPDITRACGNTPMFPLRRIVGDAPARVFAKLENFNPLWSVKDRIGVAMIEDAKARGALVPGSTIVEATSGNTGISLAFAAAARGYSLIVAMPESMSLERRRLLKAFGAKLVLTPTDRGMTGAVAEAEKIFRELGGAPNAFIPRQFENPANPAIHKKTTAEEIWRDTGGAIDILVSGVGTGGTITGVAEALKPRKPGLRTIAVEPAASTVLTQHIKEGVPVDRVRPGRHKIQGIGAGFVPGIVVDGLKRAAEAGFTLIDDVLTVTDDEAITFARRLAKEEGMFCGISCGAAAAVAVRIAHWPENAGKTIVVVLPDLGERYLSTTLYPDD